MRTDLTALLLSLFTSVSLLASPEAKAWVELEQWKKPKVFDQAPSAEIVQVGYKTYLRKPKDSEVRLSKTSANLLGLYPLLDNFVAGFTMSAGSGSVQNILAENQLRSIQTSQLSLELTGQYAFSNENSLFLSSGVGYKELEANGRTTSETSAVLKTFTMWSINDEVGLGVGAAGNANSRRSNLMPLLGGSWQPSPELRIDGWLPSHIHTRWKFSQRQSLFLRLELSGESGYAKKFFNDDDADITLVGAQMILGWSVGMPIGFSTGFLRLDPSFGFFAGNTTVKNNVTGRKTEQRMGSAPLADIRVAVVF